MNETDYDKIICKKLDDYKINPKISVNKANYCMLMNDYVIPYFIPRNEEDQFLELVHNLIKSGKFVRLSQYPEERFIFKIDFDLKMKSTDGMMSRLCNDEQIAQIVKIYGKIFDSIFGTNVPDKNVIICKRQNVELLGDIIRDGLHMYFPGIVINKNARNYINNAAAKEIFAGPLLHLASNAREILDSTVTTWRVYGCMNQNKMPYLMTYAMKYDAPIIGGDINVAKSLPENLCKYVSSHGHDLLTPVTNMDIIKQLSAIVTADVPDVNEHVNRIDKVKLDMIRDLLDHVPDINWISEPLWHKMACILVNYEVRRSPEMFEIFDQYSKTKCPDKYSREATIKKWNRPDITNKATIASLWNIIYIDNKIEYNKLVTKWSLTNITGPKRGGWNDSDCAVFGWFIMPILTRHVIRKQSERKQYTNLPIMYGMS